MRGSGRRPINRHVLAAVFALSVIVPGSIAAAQTESEPPDIVEHLVSFAEEVEGDTVASGSSDDSGFRTFADGQGDFLHPRGWQVYGSGPDLLSVTVALVEGDALPVAFSERDASGVDPAGLTFAFPDGWIPPPPDQVLLTVALSFDQPVPVSVAEPCEVAVETRTPGPTSPPFELENIDADADMNAAHTIGPTGDGQIAMVDKAIVPDGYSQLLPETSTVGVFGGSEALIITPVPDGLESIRASIRCEPMGSDYADYWYLDMLDQDIDPLIFGTVDQTTALLEFPTTTTTTTTSTTTTVAASADDPAMVTDSAPPTTTPDDDPRDSDGSDFPWWLLTAGGLVMIGVGWWLQSGDDDDDPRDVPDGDGDDPRDVGGGGLDDDGDDPRDVGGGPVTSAPRRRPGKFALDDDDGDDPRDVGGGGGGGLDDDGDDPRDVGGGGRTFTSVPRRRPGKFEMVLGDVKPPLIGPEALEPFDYD